MKANEIRVGNRLLFLGKEVEVLGIVGMPERNDMYWIQTKGMIDNKIIHFNPIPLTEEWLLKFGLEKIQDFVYVIDNELWIKLILEDENWNDVAFDVFIKGIYITNISFIHQLQNLYFALTGTELEIKSE